jgi:hypothetical protein
VQEIDTPFVRKMTKAASKQQMQENDTPFVRKNDRSDNKSDTCGKKWEGLDQQVPHRGHGSG